MTMLIGPHSAFLRLPRLNDLQRGWFEGLRFAFGMCDLAYGRLCRQLLQIAQTHFEEQGAPEPQGSLAAIADAWAFVDATWRLRALLVDRSFPKPPGPPRECRDEHRIDLAAFREATRPLQGLRNHFQHIDAPIAGDRVGDYLVWGHLFWQVPRLDLKRIDSYILVPGTMPRESMSFDGVETRPRQIRTHIDHVALNALDQRADLTDIFATLPPLVQQFEALLDSQLTDQEVDPWGHLILMSFQYENMADRDDGAA
jgi:hypothetical protein